MAHFWRVLKFAKFAGEWPFLNEYTIKLTSTKIKR
jgi:hypothetical protein